MDDLNDWIANNYKQCQPQKEHALRALRHLSRLERKNLFSDEISFMRSAEGRWFEMITYEIFLDIARKTDAIKTVVLKGADVKGKKTISITGTKRIFLFEKRRYYDKGKRSGSCRI